MYNFGSLKTAIKKVTTSVNLIYTDLKLAPIIGFIDSKVNYVTDEIIIQELFLENSYKILEPKLKTLISKIPDNMQAVDPIAQSHTDDLVIVHKAYTKDGFPYVLIIKPEETVNHKIHLHIKIVMAYAKIKLAKDF